LPHDRELAGPRSGDCLPKKCRGVPLRAGRKRVHLKLAALGGAGTVIVAPEHPPGAAIPAVALPRDREATGTVDGDDRTPLLANRVGVHEELAPLSGSGAAEALAEHTVGAAVVVGLPYHHEVARGV